MNMTAAAVTFYLICVMLGFERFKQLGKSYPAMKSLGLFSTAMGVFVVVAYLAK